MTVELWALLGVVIILFLSIFVQQIVADKVYGTKYALSNRDALDREHSPTVERLGRLVRNHVEGLAVFAPLVLIASASDVSNTFTQIASIVIVVSRAAHFVLYALGVPVIRSLAWAAGFLLATPAFIYGLIAGVGLPF